jgi:hypothetical protein
MDAGADGAPESKWPLRGGLNGRRRGCVAFAMTAR